MDNIDIFFKCKQSLPELLCEDIISIFKTEKSLNTNWLNIPKQNTKWEKIERIVYKELLVNLKKYKDELLKSVNIEENIEENIKLLSELNNELFVKDFTIQNIEQENKIRRTNNRHNVLTFIYYLNNDDNKHNVGDLLLLRDPLNNNILKTSNCKYVITGQLCSKNVV